MEGLWLLVSYKKDRRRPTVFARIYPGGEHVGDLSELSLPLSCVCGSGIYATLNLVDPRPRLKYKV